MDFHIDFSARELALLTWIFFLFILTSFSTDIRKSIWQVTKFLVDYRFLIILFATALCGIFLITTLMLLGLWEQVLYKDVIFWILGAGILSIISFQKNSEPGLFKRLIKDYFKLSLLVEFIVNRYCFSFVVELILFFLWIFSLLLYFNNKIIVKKVGSIGIYTLFIVSFSYSFSQMFLEKQTLFTLSNIKPVLLPLLLGLVTAPMIYLLALYSEYEKLFIKINLKNDSPFERRMIKKFSLITANISLNKIRILCKNLKKFRFNDLDEMQRTIRLVCQNKI